MMRTVCETPKGQKQHSSMREAGFQMALKGWISVGKQKEEGRTFQRRGWGGHEEMLPETSASGLQVSRVGGWSAQRKKWRLGIGGKKILDWYKEEQGEKGMQGSTLVKKSAGLDDGLNEGDEEGDLDIPTVF